MQTLTNGFKDFNLQGSNSPDPQVGDTASATNVETQSAAAVVFNAMLSQKDVKQAAANDITSAVDLTSQSATAKTTLTATAAASPETSQQLLKQIQFPQGKLSEAVKRISVLLTSEGKFKFTATREHAELHDLLTTVTLEIRKNEKMKSIWQAFLTQNDGATVYYPRYHTRKLDLYPELQYLKDLDLKPEDLKLKAESLHSDTTTLDADLDQVVDCEGDAFGLMGKSRKGLSPLVSSDGGSLIIVRDINSDKILGSLAASKHREDANTETWFIHSLTRRANAAKRGVGCVLIEEFLKQIKECKVTLTSREGNKPATALYKKYNFKIVGEPRPYFSEPRENIINMERPAFA